MPFQVLLLSMEIQSDEKGIKQAGLCPFWIYRRPVKKPTAACNLVPDIYADICWCHSTLTAVQMMTDSSLLHFSLLFLTIYIYDFPLFFWERALENANGRLWLMAQIHMFCKSSMYSVRRKLNRPLHMCGKMWSIYVYVARETKQEC